MNLDNLILLIFEWKFERNIFHIGWFIRGELSTECWNEVRNQY